MSDEEQRTAVLKQLAERPRSPRELEEAPPQSLTPKQARLVVQSLLDEGLVALNDNLKLVKQ